jgi:phage-related protein
VTTPSGSLVGDATIRVTADTDDASRAITRFASTAVRSLGSIGPALVPLAGIGASIGTAVPAIAGVAAAVGNLLPAATAAATGFVAIRLAAGTVQLAMVGVEDAISAAFATGEGSAEKFQESLERLAPSARAAVVEIRGMRDQLIGVQQSVQQNFFAGFAGEIRDLSESVLPVLDNGLNTTSQTLNQMALGASDAAQQLAADGTLGRAISGANTGLFNLRDVPAQVITAFGQLAAAGAPVFDRLTEAAANAATGISDALSGAVESGGLDQAVQTASDLFASLLPIAQDVLGILGNLFEAASVGGDDLFQVIGSVLDALNQFTGSSAFQEAIGALAETMGVVGETVAPLLLSALEALAPVFPILAGPIQNLVSTLGDALTPIIEAIAPLLITVAEGIGSLADAIAPVLPIVGDLIAQLGPILQPILDFLVQQMQTFAPAVLQVAEVLGTALQPILAALPQVIEPILQAFLRLIQAALPVLLELLIELSPTLVELTVLLADLLIELTPLIVAVLDLATNILNFLMPAISGAIRIIGGFARVLSRLVSGVIRGVVMPIVRALTSLINGDFLRAFSSAREVVSRVLSAIGSFFRNMASTANTALRNTVDFVRDRVSDIVNFFQDMPGRVVSALSNLGSRLRETVRNAVQRAVDATTDRIDRIVDIIDGLPQRAKDALGDLGRTLYNAGRDLVQGFIDGIGSLVQEVEDTIGGLIDSATGWLPGSPAEKGPLSGQGYVLLRGQRFTEDFARGIEEPQRMVENASRRLASSSLAGFDELGRPNLPLALTPTAGTTRPAPVQPMTINFTNRGVIGSRAEVMNWLVSALDHLARQNRLPRNRNTGGATLR